MAGERRSGRDRRQNARRGAQIKIEWESEPGARKEGTITDISATGCFVLSAGDVADGETVRLLLPVSGGMKAQIIAQVVNHIFEIGFAVRFAELSESQRNFIEKIVQLQPKE